jgi:hypothetical protein
MLQDLEGKRIECTCISYTYIFKAVAGLLLNGGYSPGTET